MQLHYCSIQHESRHPPQRNMSQRNSWHSTVQCGSSRCYSRHAGIEDAGLLLTLFHRLTFSTACWHRIHCLVTATQHYNSVQSTTALSWQAFLRFIALQHPCSLSSISTMTSFSEIYRLTPSPLYTPASSQNKLFEMRCPYNNNLHSLFHCNAQQCAVVNSISLQSSFIHNNSQYPLESSSTVSSAFPSAIFQCSPENSVGEATLSEHSS